MERGVGREEGEEEGVHSLRFSIQRAHGAVGGCWGALEGVSAGCRVGRCCRVKDVNARDTSRALGSAFAMHSMRALKRRRAARERFICVYLPRNVGKKPETHRGRYAHLLG